MTSTGAKTIASTALCALLALALAGPAVGQGPKDRAEKPAAKKADPPKAVKVPKNLLDYKGITLTVAKPEPPSVAFLNGADDEAKWTERTEKDGAYVSEFRATGGRWRCRPTAYTQLGWSASESLTVVCTRDPAPPEATK